MKTMQPATRDENGFTGLEAALVFIAFVIVAAVLSYVVLGAGFFTAQKSQQVIGSGVTQVASNLMVKGNIYVMTPDGVNNTIQFDIALAAGVFPVDVDKLLITMSTPSSAPEVMEPNHIPGDLYPAPGYWAVYMQEPAPQGNSILNEGETFTIHLTPPADMPLSPGTQFNIELKPEYGAALQIVRTIPAGETGRVKILY